MDPYEIEGRRKERSDCVEETNRKRRAFAFVICSGDYTFRSIRWAEKMVDLLCAFGFGLFNVPNSSPSVFF